MRHYQERAVSRTRVGPSTARLRHVQFQCPRPYERRLGRQCPEQTSEKEALLVRGPQGLSSTISVRSKTSNDESIAFPKKRIGATSSRFSSKAISKRNPSHNASSIGLWAASQPSFERSRADGGHCSKILIWCSRRRVTWLEATPIMRSSPRPPQRGYRCTQLIPSQTSSASKW